MAENRDAAFFFQVVRVHHAFDDALIVAERAGLLQQAIDQGGLAVVDVGDNGDVAQFHGKSSFQRARRRAGALCAFPPGEM